MQKIRDFHQAIRQTVSNSPRVQLTMHIAEILVPSPDLVIGTIPGERLLLPKFCEASVVVKAT